ncbi:hypothetical protein BS47DRAFT_1365854 [Hydnum rufescens UP504]|uniref:Uncharacterized protein n=1 Tax=Hydnum rufescens UP504 TaxID=1448309 RepID=A0A9P6ANN0_9AGAM|nr:hypothetical protein BS47DRAFT_1365854 [Hydnum rufescens UP504]
MEIRGVPVFGVREYPSEDCQGILDGHHPGQHTAGAHLNIGGMAAKTHIVHVEALFEHVGHLNPWYICPPQGYPCQKDGQSLVSTLEQLISFSSLGYGPFPSAQGFVPTLYHVKYVSGLGPVETLVCPARYNADIVNEPSEDSSAPTQASTSVENDPYHSMYDGADNDDDDWDESEDDGLQGNSKDVNDQKALDLIAAAHRRDHDAHN